MAPREQAGCSRTMEDEMEKGANTDFGIPAEFRAFADKSMEQARQTFESLFAAAEHAANAAAAQATNVQTGTREVSTLAIRFAERNITASFEFAQRLARAKDAQEIVNLHAEYASNQMAALGEQASELGRQAAKMAGQGAH